MALGITAMQFAAGAAVAGTAYAIDSGEKNRTAMHQQQDEAKASAKVLADKADQANNAATAKKPNLATLLGANQAAAKGGVSGTMLTGPAGIDPNTLQLGKNTLLGS